MRLLRLTTNPQGYIRTFYGERPSLDHEDYTCQYQTLMSDFYAWADSWTQALMKYGYTVWEPVGNAEVMQKTWAKEHDAPYEASRWLLDITAQQVMYFKPNIIFVNDYNTYTPEFLRNLREACQEIKLILGWCGAPFRYIRQFSEYDIVLTNIPVLKERFRRSGIASEYFPHAFDPRICHNINGANENTLDVSFIGSIYLGQNYHQERERLLKYLIDKVDISIWANFIDNKSSLMAKFPILRNFYAALNASRWCIKDRKIAENIGEIVQVWRKYYTSQTGHIDHKIMRIANEPLYGLKMFSKLSHSKVTLNTHIILSKDFASNMRLFEATGVGACLLTENQKNLPDLFEPDKEVVTYSSNEEAEEKIKYLLANENVRHEIAVAGRNRTLRDHTFDVRSIRLIELINKYIK